MLDKSGSIRSSTVYNQEKSFARQLVELFSKNSDQSLFGVVTFGNEAQVETNPGLTSNTSAISTINGLRYPSSQYTDTQQAFEACGNVLSAAPAGFPKIQVLITDGNPTAFIPDSQCDNRGSDRNCPQSCYRDTVCRGTGSATTIATDEANKQATQQKSDGSTVITVGVGSGISTSNLERWASTDDLSFTASSFTNLDSLLNLIDGAKICTG